MPNDSASDNILTPRTVVAAATAAHWVGASPSAPDGSRYVRGTVELSDNSTGTPLVGVIESCEFEELGADEELSDGACGVEAYDFYELGWKCSVTARFRKKDDPPRKGEIFTLYMPEGGQADNLPLRFVCTSHGTSWSEKGLRKCKFEGKMHVSMAKAELLTAKLTGDAGATAEDVTNSSAPSPGFGDLTSGTAASGVLTSTGTNIADGDTITIDGQAYRGKDTMAAAYDFQRGTSAANSLANLKMALNASGVPGTNYYAGTLAHPTVEAGTLTSTTLTVSAKVTGTGGNSIATTEASTQLSWGAATLTGGA